MCDIATAGFALTALSTAYGVYSSESARNQAMANAQAQARYMGMAANYERGKAQVQQEEVRMETSALKARQRVLYAKGGVDVGVGSAVDVQADTEALGKYQEKQIQTAADYRAWELETGASMALFEGSQRASAYRSESVGSLLSGLGAGLKYATDTGMISKSGGKMKWDWTPNRPPKKD